MYEFDYFTPAQLQYAERNARYRRVHQFAKNHRNYVNRAPVHPAPAQWKRVCRWVKVKPEVPESNPFMATKYRNYRRAHSQEIMKWKK